jgi:hypothetical protein
MGAEPESAGTVEVLARRAWHCAGEVGETATWARPELARHAEVTPAAVTRYERGPARPTTTGLARIGLLGDAG